MGRASKASNRKGMPACETFCEKNKREGALIASLECETNSRTLATRMYTASVSTAFHLHAPPSPTNTPARQKRSLLVPAFTGKTRAALKATRLHIRKNIRNTSTVAMRDIKNRKLLKRASPAARKAKSASCSSRKAQR